MRRRAAQPLQSQRAKVPDLAGRIAAKTAKIGIIGLGYVGLPLACLFAEKGFGVIGFDIDPKKIGVLNAGRSYIKHIPATRIRPLVKMGKLAASDDFAALKRMDAIIICVPTPLTKFREPDLRFIVTTGEAVARYLRKGQIVVLESSTYPGTTTEVLKPILERGGLKSGRDFHLAYSPEREDPGNEKFGTAAIPKVVGGDGAKALKLAKQLYDAVVVKTVPVSSPETAEVIKLTENIFRAVNIALVNELKVICAAMGIDVWEVIEAAKTKPFGFMPFYPGPGLGGHCIPIDPFYLSWKLKTLNYRARFIELAGEVNSEMPEYVCARAADALNDREKSVKGSRILVLGVTYKRDIEDVRESPALDIIRILEKRGARITYHDPFVPQLELDGVSLSSQELMPAVKEADLVLIVTDHSAFKYPQIVEAASIVLDTRNATRGLRSEKILKI